jgi:hypothetical protein
VARRRIGGESERPAQIFDDPRAILFVGVAGAEAVSDVVIQQPDTLISLLLELIE